MLLDAGPPGMACHPQAETRHGALVQWLGDLLEGGVSVRVPEAADYENTDSIKRRARYIRCLDGHTFRYNHRNGSRDRMKRATAEKVRAGQHGKYDPIG